MSDQIIIFDTTLRDGEQSPGCSMTIAEKLLVAEALVDLNVDVIEAGFPIASPGDFDAVKQIAERFGSRTTICGLARSRTDDITRAWEAVRHAERPRIHVFLATSAIHREHKLKMDKETIVKTAVEMTRLAIDQFDGHAAVPNVEFSPEDAARTEIDFLCEVVERVIEAGATTVNIPDTVGYTVPQRYFDIITALKQNVSNIDKAVISTHCHNDLGLAVANSLAAVEAGARQIECTINGLGERAGNASLEEVVMAIRTRADHYNVTTNINTPKLCGTSKLVSKVTGMKVQRNKAIVGQNAFAHEAGIHQHGILQERTTYEIMRPEDVGYVGENLVLGKHSGRHAFKDRVKSLGFELGEAQLQKAFDDFIKLADRKKSVYDADIIALIDSQKYASDPDAWKLLRFTATGGAGSLPTATVELDGPARDGSDSREKYCDAATGDGPVDAVFLALERTTGISAKLIDYEVRSVTSGKDAMGEVLVEIEVPPPSDDGQSTGTRFHGRGISTDVIEASALAYLQALNNSTAGTVARSPEAGV